MIPTSNRLMLTKITVNEYVPMYQPFFKYIEEHSEKISSNVLSSFNCLQDKDLLKERLDFVKQHVDKYKAANPKGIVFFEDAHYHSREIRDLCLEIMYPSCDIVCMNEEELAYTLKSVDYDVDIEDIISCVEGARFIREKYGIQKGVIIHTGNLCHVCRRSAGSRYRAGTDLRKPFGYRQGCQWMVCNERTDQRVTGSGSVCPRHGSIRDCKEQQIRKLCDTGAVKIH